MFDKTDDYQYRRYIGDREYLFIEAIEDASYDGTQIPETEDAYAVYSGLVRLDDYSQEEIECIVLTYYSSYDSFLDAYKGETKEEIDGLIAEMIFETEMLDNAFHGHFTEAAADTFMQYWMDEYEKPEAQAEMETGKYSIGDWVTIKTECLPEGIKQETSLSTGIVGNIAGDVIRVDLETEFGVVPVEVGEEDIRHARQVKLKKEDIRINELTIEDKFGDVCTESKENQFDTGYGYAAVADYQTWLDVDAYFGTRTRDDDSTWINFYTEYDENGVLGAYYVISSDDNEEIHAWELTGEEKTMLMELLNEKAKEDGYTDIGDFLISELKEMDAPEKE